MKRNYLYNSTSYITSGEMKVSGVHSGVFHGSRKADVAFNELLIYLRRNYSDSIVVNDFHKI